MADRPLRNAPAWLRLSVRVLVLLPIWPLHVAGQLAEWAYRKVDPYLPRGIEP